MEHQLTIYNTLNRKKELFVPLHAPHVGMYVCGPTVYGDQIGRASCRKECRSRWSPYH